LSSAVAAASPVVAAVRLRVAAFQRLVALALPPQFHVDTYAPAPIIPVERANKRPTVAFWTKLESEEVRASVELPPLTDATVAACEKKFALKLPQALLKLLREQNGGILENTHFRFQGTVSNVVQIFGLEEKDGFRGICAASQLMDDSDPLGADQAQRLRQKAGDLSRLLRIADADWYWYALDYNHPNSNGEPPVLLVTTNEDDAGCHRVADSFAELLLCQYFGDPEPTVQLSEAEKLNIIAEGGYSGTSQRTNRPVRVSWRICSRRNRLIVLSSEDWGIEEEGPEFSRVELLKSDLCFGGELTEQSIADLGPELTDLIRSNVEVPSIEEHDVGVSPTCYSLRLDAPPHTKGVHLQVSKPYKGRWKNNSRSPLTYASVYSADRAALERTMVTVAKSCQGLKRFLL